jgi:hypothetical protein
MCFQLTPLRGDAKLSFVDDNKPGMAATSDQTFMSKILVPGVGLEHVSVVAIFSVFSI